VAGCGAPARPAVHCRPVLTGACRAPLRRRVVHPCRAGAAGALRHRRGRSRLRPHRPARGREGRGLRPLLALAEEPAPPPRRRVRRGAGAAPRRGGRRRELEGGRAAALYERVFGDYGDDSVAQLGGAHVAVEQASNLLTKQLEWGRLAAYLEQSTRYIPYDDKPGGRYRYYRDPDIMASRHAAVYERELDAVFDTYAALLPRVRAWAEERFPRDEATSGRLPGHDHREDLRPAARSAPGCDGQQRRDLRQRAGLREPAAAPARQRARRGPLRR
jgi:hypothetical protein